LQEEKEKCNIIKTICINVKDTINSPSALTREQGRIIHKIIKEKILGGYKVELDFQDVESLIILFLNVAIGKLYEHFSSEDLQERLKVINIPQGKSLYFNIVIENAKKCYFIPKTVIPNNKECS